MIDYSAEALAAKIRAARAQGLAYRLSRSAADIRSELRDSLPKSIHTPFPLVSFPFYEVSTHTAIGNRVSQEDRFTVCPEVVKGHPDSGFFGVFDGTVGDFASDTVKDLVVPHLIGSQPWPRIVDILNNETSRTVFSSHERAKLDSDSEPAVSQENVELNPTSRRCADPESGTTTSESVSTTVHATEELPGLLWRATEWMYLNADTELLDLCSLYKKDYASSTAVTVLLVGGYGCVGHLGDSRVAIGYERNGILCGEFLTEDHKPNVIEEQQRILRCGGTVEYLHNHNYKPFIRGGDFTQRKSRGEQPMQLQYSRAFGGKDLKMYGLSSEPDLRVFKIEPTHHVLILASDGIWDVQTAGRSVEIVMMARRCGEDPATALVQMTLNEQQAKNQNADNLTVIVIFLDGAKYYAHFQTPA